jgi:hypothetical protein
MTRLIESTAEARPETAQTLHARIQAMAKKFRDEVARANASDDKSPYDDDNIEAAFVLLEQLTKAPPPGLARRRLAKVLTSVQAMAGSARKWRACAMRPAKPAAERASPGHRSSIESVGAAGSDRGHAEDKCHRRRGSSPLIEPTAS